VSQVRLARRFGLSERTLTRRFAAATGRGPRAYVHARTQQAMRLLETTGDPTGQIQRRVGYGDPAAFRRAFRPGHRAVATPLPRRLRREQALRRLNRARRARPPTRGRRRSGA
jgi:transcriptional regulator GlxA family with amidase domain